MRINLNKIILLLFSIFLFFGCSIAQVRDTSSNKKLTINGFCLCEITVSSLRNFENDLKEVNVEEMDLPKACLGQDSRFVAGKGYQAKRYPGMVFQQDQNSDRVSKIRLTKEFKGKLPDGHFIDMQKLLLKDLFVIYPQLEKTWGSRGCSNYWNFSNDTISFFVKIDSTKQPQFPIDEAYYMNKPIEAVDLVTSCYKGDESDSSINEVLLEPLYFVDSVQMTKADLSKYSPNDFATLTVYTDPKAIKKLGLITTSKVFYLTTKHFLKERNWNYLKEKSDEYSKLVPTAESDSLIQYILNNKALKDLSEIVNLNNTVFRQIEIVDKQQLIKKYKIINKNYGVIITTINDKKQSD